MDSSWLVYKKNEIDSFFKKKKSGKRKEKQTNRQADRHIYRHIGRQTDVYIQNYRQTDRHYHRIIILTYRLQEIDSELEKHQKLMYSQKFYKIIGAIKKESQPYHIHYRQFVIYLTYCIRFFNSYTVSKNAIIFSIIILLGLNTQTFTCEPNRTINEVHFG